MVTMHMGETGYTNLTRSTVAVLQLQKVTTSTHGALRD